MAVSEIVGDMIKIAAARHNRLDRGLTAQGRSRNVPAELNFA
jgi:hypothetical protein